MLGVSLFINFPTYVNNRHYFFPYMFVHIVFLWPKALHLGVTIKGDACTSFYGINYVCTPQV